MRPSNNSTNTLPSNENSLPSKNALNPRALEFVPNSIRAAAPRQEINSVYSTATDEYDASPYGSPYPMARPMGMPPQTMYHPAYPTPHGNPYPVARPMGMPPQTMYHPAYPTPHGNPYPVAQPIMPLQIMYGAPRPGNYHTAPLPSIQSIAPKSQHHSDVLQSSPVTSPTSPETRPDVPPQDAISKAPQLVVASVFVYGIPKSWSDSDFESMIREKYKKDFVNAKMMTKNGEPQPCGFVNFEAAQEAEYFVEEISKLELRHNGNLIEFRMKGAPRSKPVDNGQNISQQNSDVLQSSPVASPTSPESISLDPYRELSTAEVLKSAPEGCIAFIYGIPDHWRHTDLMNFAKTMGTTKGIRHVRMMTKDNQKMNYGCAIFNEHSDAKVFTKSMQGLSYDTRHIEVRLITKKTNQEPIQRKRVRALAIHYSTTAPFKDHRDVLKHFEIRIGCPLTYWRMKGSTVTVAPTNDQDCDRITSICNSDPNIIKIEEKSVSIRSPLKSLPTNTSTHPTAPTSQSHHSNLLQFNPVPSSWPGNLTSGAVNAIQVVKIDGSSWSLDEVKGFWYAVFRKLKMTTESATQWTDLLAIHIDRNEVTTTFPNELIQESFIDPITNIPDWKISFMFALLYQVPKSIKKMYTDEFIEVGYSAISAQSVQLSEEKTPLTVLEPAPTVRASELGTIEQQRNYTQEQPAAFALPYSLFIGINEPHQNIINAVFQAELPVEGLTHYRERTPEKSDFWHMASGSIEVIYSSGGAYYTRQDYERIMNDLFRSLSESGIRHFTIRIYNNSVFTLEEIDPDILVLFRGIRDQQKLIELYDTIKTNQELRIAQANRLSIFHQPAIEPVIEEPGEPLCSQETPPSDTDGSPTLK